MKYMLLIYDDEQARGQMSEGDRGSMMKEYGQFTEDIRKSGHYVTGSQLQPAAAATSVRVRNGKRVLTDGPFAETREQLGGYYMVEAKDLDEALSLAARVPGAKVGTIEVRPLVEMRAPAAV